MSWSSKLSFIVTSIGAAVGLGSLWFLPYQVYLHGGAVFFFIFALSTLTLGVLALTAEIEIGAFLKQSLHTGLPQISPALGRPLSLLFYATLFGILSFYSVITSQTLFCFIAQLGAILGIHSSPLVWPSLIAPLESSLGLSLAFLTLFWLMILAVISLPLQKGLERISWWLMVCLVLTLCLLISFSAYQGFLMQGFVYLFTPSFEKFSFSSLQAAIGASLFGLAVGAGCMMSYGSYLNTSSRRELLFHVFVIALSCLFIALLSCLSLFPYVLEHGSRFVAGPTLVFEVLPVVFLSFGSIGSFLSLLYMLALFSAGFTSCFSLIEPFVILLTYDFKKTRFEATKIVIPLFFVSSAILVLDNSNSHSYLMESLIDLVTGSLLPLGVIGTALIYIKLRTSK